CPARSIRGCSRPGLPPYPRSRTAASPTTLLLQERKAPAERDSSVQGSQSTSGSIVQNSYRIILHKSSHLSLDHCTCSARNASTLVKLRPAAIIEPQLRARVARGHPKKGDLQ